MTAPGPMVEWPQPDEPAAARPCPNCGAPGDKPRVLSVAWQTPDHPRRRTSVLRCPACTARFFDDQTPPDYAEPALLERGRVPFYLQQGAGLGLVTAPLARLDFPAGARMLDVGCGFGFALDFARHAKGWEVAGIDPAPLSGLGRERLGLPIALRYAGPGDGGTRDRAVVLSSETVEHVPSPAAFVRLLASCLAPDGVLILTTPDADRLCPATPGGALITLLSPGLHLVFQTAESLRGLLVATGLPHVRIERDAYALVAFASAVPLRLRPRDPHDPALRAYLRARGQTLAADRDLALGFAGRAFGEAVSAADWAMARAVWDALRPEIVRGFGFDPETAALPPVPHALDALADAMPLGLAGLFYGRAMLHGAEGGGRGEATRWFDAGVAAASALRRALHGIAIDDMMTERIGWLCEAEACLCRAEAGDGADAIARLARLGPAPFGAEAAAAREILGWRMLVGLVNAGAYAAARALDLATERMSGAVPADLRRDALFCCGVLDLQAGGDDRRARRLLHAVRTGLAETVPGHALPPLFWAALRGEIVAADRLDPAEGAVLRHAVAAELGARAADAPADLGLPA